MQLRAQVVLVLALLAAVPMWPPALGAQETRIAVWRLDTALAALERGERASTSVIGAAFGENSESYTASQRALLLDHLERIALGKAGRSNGDADPALLAISTIGRIGLDTAVPSATRALIPDKLLRIYDQSKHFESRVLATSYLGHLLESNPQQLDAILGLFAQIATATPAPDAVPPAAAVDWLLLAGPPGIAVLRRLHEANSITDPSTRAYVMRVAKGGYTYRPYRPRTPE